jgi:antitoxin component YwqK of YwqJK toxin-antitoxin module
MDACEGKTASCILKLMAALFMCVLFAACNHYYASHNIYVENGLIYKQGESKPFTGRILDTLNNKIVEYDVVNGLRTGEFCVSTPGGVFTVSGLLKDNKNEGIWSYYYENGQLESRGNFRNDLPHGKWQWFYSDGTLKAEGCYVDGHQEGEWKAYNEQGALSSIFRFSRGEKTNEVIFASHKII